jgi:hypothetical protein
MKIVICNFILLAAFQSSITFAGNICEKLNVLNGTYEADEIQRLGITSGPTITNDVNEYNDPEFFPVEIKEVVREYSRLSKISVYDLVEQFIEVRTIFEDAQKETAAGYVITFIDDLTTGSGLLSGAVYKLESDKLKLVGLIENDMLKCEQN